MYNRRLLPAASVASIEIDSSRLIALSISLFATIALTCTCLVTIRVAPHLLLYFTFVSAVVLVVSVLVHAIGMQRVGELCLYVAAATVAMNDVRVASWMTLSDVFLLASFFFLLIGERRLTRPDTLYPIACASVGLIVCGALLGSYFSDDLGASLSSLLRFCVAAVGMMGLFYIWSPSRQQLENVLWFFILSVCISAVYALAFDPGDRRAVGLSTHPNHLGLTAFLAAGPCIAFCWKDGGLRFVALSALLLLLVAVGVSGSRAAIVGLVAIAAVMTFTAKGGTLWAWISVIGLLAMLAISSGLIDPPPIAAIDRLFNEDSTSVSASNEGRFEKLSTSFSLVKEHPLTGAGFENARFAHNIYLQVAASAGLIGFIGFCVLMIKVVVLPTINMWWVFKVEDPLLLGVLASLVAYLVAGMFGNQVWDRYIWFMIASSIAVIATQPLAQKERNHESQVNGRLLARKI